MLIRRAAEAGYTGVTPHQFRHTFSDGWLASGGSEGDLTAICGRDEQA
jgi:integrase